MVNQWELTEDGLEKNFDTNTLGKKKKLYKVIRNNPDIYSVPEDEMLLFVFTVEVTTMGQIK